MEWELVASLRAGSLCGFGERPRGRYRLEWSQTCSTVDLAVKHLCLMLICKGESSHVVIGLEGVKEGHVLVVVESLIEFLFPDDTLSIEKVDDAEKEGIAGLNQGDGSEDTGICPLGRIWVGDIESCDGGGDDASVRRGEEPFDCCLVLWVVECDAGHPFS